MFGQVTHTLHGAAMRVRSSFTSFTFCNISGSFSLIPKDNICCSITCVPFTCVSLIEVSATINLYYYGNFYLFFIWSSGFLFIRSSGFGQLEQLGPIPKKIIPRVLKIIKFWLIFFYFFILVQRNMVEQRHCSGQS